MSGPAPAPQGEPTAADILSHAVTAGTLPGAVFATGTGTGISDVIVVGRAQDRGGPAREMRRDTMFDLASLTKVVATLPAVLRLVDTGDVALDDPATRYLPGFHGAGRDHVTIRNLLTHTSGLPAEVFFWRECRDPAEAAQALLSVQLENPPDTAVVYSDVGFLLLGEIIAAVTHGPLEMAIAELVLGPLELDRATFSPSLESRLLCAATELSPDGTAIVGAVHDENARFLGGVAGHAGMFAPVDDLIRYVIRAWLDTDGSFLRPALRAEACRLQTPGLGGRRGLGWVLRQDTADVLGQRWPMTAVSHTGFTGTSIAVDPDSERWSVLLTNDVHFGRGRGTIRAIREAVHDSCAPAM